MATAFFPPFLVPASLTAHRRHKPLTRCSSMPPPAALMPFTVKNHRGNSLACVLDEAPATRAPIAVLVHGFRDSKNGQCISSIAAEMRRRGTRTVRFDCAGNGDSEGAFQFANYRDEAEDLRAVVESVRSMGLDVGTIVGHSKGAGVVLIYAQKYSDVPLVVPLAPRFHMATGMEERFGAEILREVRKNGSADVTLRDGFRFALTAASLDERLGLDMGEIVRGIPGGVQVVIVHGDEDRTIPVEHATAFNREIEGCKVVIVKGGDHNFRGKEKEVVDGFM